jgi:hypothetical protein
VIAIQKFGKNIANYFVSYTPSVLKASSKIKKREQYCLKDTLAAAISMAGDASLISLTTKVQLLNPKSKLLLPQVVNYHTGVPIRGPLLQISHSSVGAACAHKRRTYTNLYYILA